MAGLSENSHGDLAGASSELMKKFSNETKALKNPVCILPIVDRAKSQLGRSNEEKCTNISALASELASNEVSGGRGMRPKKTTQRYGF